MIFSKSSSTPTPDPEPARPGSKGRPTRTRKEAEAARRRPLVVDDRKEARRRSREQASRTRGIEQRALMTGDEKNMPAQHRGRDRRLVRDIVDARRNLAEYFFPVAIVFMVLSLVLPLINANLYTLMSVGMLVVLWGGILLCVVDAFRLRRVLRARLEEAFGVVSPGLVSYGVMRAIQIRRFRLPKPAIKHGEEVR
ncbi:DUF3043 domain-containing protein [Brachybacterium sp. DNPG3]